MQLKIRALQFDVKEASIGAAISDNYWCDTYNRGQGKELHWFVDVDVYERELDDQIWSPRIYHQLLHLPIKHWMDLDGQIVSWDSPFDAITGEKNCGFYVFEHGDIPRSTLSFFNRQGRSFSLDWEGVCDIFWDDEYGENVPFRAKALATFNSVRVGGSEKDTDETMRARLACYLDADDFTQKPIEFSDRTYKSGVVMAHTIFEPKL